MANIRTVAETSDRQLSTIVYCNGSGSLADRSGFGRSPGMGGDCGQGPAGERRLSSIHPSFLRPQDATLALASRRQAWIRLIAFSAHVSASSGCACFCSISAARSQVIAAARRNVRQRNGEEGPLRPDPLQIRLLRSAPGFKGLAMYSGIVSDEKKWVAGRPLGFWRSPGMGGDCGQGPAGERRLSSIHPSFLRPQDATLALASRRQAWIRLIAFSAHVSASSGCACFCSISAARSQVIAAARRNVRQRNGEEGPLRRILFKSGSCEQYSGIVSDESREMGRKSRSATSHTSRRRPGSPANHQRRAGDAGDGAHSGVA